MNDQNKMESSFKTRHPPQKEEMHNTPLTPRHSLSHNHIVQRKRRRKKDCKESKPKAIEESQTASSFESSRTTPFSTAHRQQQAVPQSLINHSAC
jgi:hypothetical protein